MYEPYDDLDEDGPCCNECGGTDINYIDQFGTRLIYYCNNCEEEFAW